jgi:hypothetical protein
MCISSPNLINFAKLGGGGWGVRGGENGQFFYIRNWKKGKKENIG